MMAGVIVVENGDSPQQAAPSALEPVYVPGPPQQLFVRDGDGILATLTVGAKTVLMRGPQRTFTETKRPFTDSFTRTVSSGFGISPAGGNWLHLTGTSGNFSVNGSQGVILNDVANTSRYATLNDSNVADFNATARVTLTATPAGASSSVSLLGGYSDSNNHYRARLTITTTGTVQLALEYTLDSTVTTLGASTTVGSGFTANQWWRIRLQRTGSTLRCRAWLDGSSEPSTWTYSVTDTTFPSGRIGFRTFASTGSTVVPYNTLVDDLVVDTVNWADPPSVTHNTWVRVLPQPFDGVWTNALADQIRAWAISSAPDALAYAMMYIAGAPDVFDPVTGHRVYGQSLYGPTAADGTRIEFSDFNDFWGAGWTFPNGETRSFPHGSVTSSGGLDCSGFTRMVYGFNMGIPMTFDQNFDGINLPRRTRDIGPSGPGIIVQQATGVAPPLTGLQVGDLILFDADTNEPVEGQTDHVGIYLGYDKYLNYRFISSRKTVNGPTMSDMGGNSTLNGTGTYATRLRIIRRI
jgi:cell wall-associated NlpC family hydrolase